MIDIIIEKNRLSGYRADENNGFTVVFLPLFFFWEVFMRMSVRSLCLLLMVLFLSSAFVGCSSGPTRYLASDVCMIKTGQTSRLEVLELMGEPDSKRMVAESTEQWVSYEEDRSALQATPMVGGAFDPNGYHMVVITLADDIVATCKYSAYNEDEFDWQDDYSWQEIKKK